MASLPPKNTRQLESWIHEIAAGSGSKTEKEIDEIGNHLNAFLRHSIESVEKQILEKWNMIGSSAQNSDMPVSIDNFVVW